MHENYFLKETVTINFVAKKLSKIKSYKAKNFSFFIVARFSLQHESNVCFDGKNIEIRSRSSNGRNTVFGSVCKSFEYYNKIQAEENGIEKAYLKDETGNEKCPINSKKLINRKLRKFFLTATDAFFWLQNFQNR